MSGIGPISGNGRRTVDGLDFFWNGTLWLSTQLFMGHVYDNTLSASLTYARVAPPAGLYSDLWLENLIVSYNVGTTNDASNYWALNCRKQSAALAATTLATISTAAGGLTAHNESAAIGALLGAFPIIDFQALKTGSAGALTVAAAVTYRMVTP